MVRRACLLLAFTLTACGRDMPTTPLEACPPTAANFVRTDTLYFPTTPRTVAYFVDVYACGTAKGLVVR